MNSVAKQLKAAGASAENRTRIMLEADYPDRSLFDSRQNSAIYEVEDTTVDLEVDRSHVSRGAYVVKSLHNSSQQIDIF